MELVLLLEKRFDSLAVHFVRHAAIDGANGRALRLFVEALAFRALIRSNVISIHGAGLVTLAGVCRAAIHQNEVSLYCGTVGYRPFYPTLINRIVRAFRLAGSAIDTLVSNLNGHKEKGCSEILRPKVQFRTKKN